MDKAAARLADAVDAGETIAIFGDYDVDGATSAALLTLLLRRLGVEPMVYIPDRLMEGYGPSGAALVELKRRGASLAITVDCGAQAFEALQEAADAGLDVIVCDHHQCATSLPIALALINPNRLDESEIGAAHGHVAAVGMAFLLGVALLRELRSRGRFADRPEPKIIDLLDIVALGTVADVARLKTLNRAFVTQGLKVMAERRNIGLVALAEAARLVKAPTCRDLGFALGPRINAGGRVGKSDLGVRLLTATDPEEARTIAAELDRLNEERRAIEMLVTEQASEAGRSPGRRAADPGFGPRLASRRDRHRRQPAEGALRPPGDRHRRGGGRHRQGLGPVDFSGVDLGAAVLAAKDSGLLIAGGGHAMAAGLTVAPGGIEPLRAFLAERMAADVEAALGGRALLLDALLAPGGVAGEPVRCARCRRTLWRRLAGAARRRRPGAADAARHRRQRPCPGNRLRRRWQVVQADRLPRRRNRTGPGAAVLAGRQALVAGGHDQARRVERRQCRGNASGGRRPRLTESGRIP